MKINLNPVTPEFTKAISRHNGIEPIALKQHKPKINTKPALIDSMSVEKLSKATEILLSFIDPDEGYEVWTMIVMAVNHEFNGTQKGFELVNAWSSKNDKYDGHDSLLRKYNSCSLHSGDGYTLASVIDHAKKLGNDVSGALKLLNSDFDFVNTEVVNEPIEVGDKVPPVDEPSESSDKHTNPLIQFSLLGKSAEYETQFAEAIPLFIDLAMQQQSTLLYARFNVGKTLIVLWLIRESIKQGLINPWNLIYVNADDNARGLVDKMQIAEELGFHMIAPHFEGFDHKNMLNMLVEMAKNDTADGVIVVLDTFKKFTDPMDKRKARHFGNIVRQFVLKGGTVVSLAHVNKRRDSDGNPVFAGVSDPIDDADCAYIVDVVKEDEHRRTIRFKNEKGRGYVANEVYFSYSINQKQSYRDLLDSVELVDPTSIQTPAQKEAERVQKRESQCINSIISFIKGGTTKKMDIVTAVRSELNEPRSFVQDILEKHTGFYWDFEVKEKGAKVYYLTDLPEAPEDSPESGDLGT